MADPTPLAEPQPETPTPPSPPTPASSTPASSTPAPPASGSPPVDAPPAKTGFPAMFGAGRIKAPRPPVSPDAQLRGRLKILGVVFIIIGSLMAASMLPALVPSVRERARAAPGGDLTVHLVNGATPLVNVSVSLSYNGMNYTTAATDGGGLAKFATITHSGSTVSFTHQGRTWQREVEVMPKETATVDVDVASDPLTEAKKEAPSWFFILIGIVYLSPVLMAIGGVSMVLARWRLVALAGCSGAMLLGIFFILQGGLLIGVVIGGAAVFAVMTIRRAAHLFDVTRMAPPAQP